MFGRNKKPKIQVDKDQLEFIQNAQKRVKQKKLLYSHFILFLIAGGFMILANVVMGIGKDWTLLGRGWSLYAVLIWGFFLCYHFFSVFVSQRFMGRHWEKKQIDKLVAKQQARVASLEKKLANEQGTSKKIMTKNSPVKAQQSHSELTIIVAASENNAIGKDNTLIWHLKDDLKRFKALTSGHHIIMGRKTFESFPKPLPNRKHIVITSQKKYKAPAGVIIVNSLKTAIDIVENDTQPFVIGGGEIYQQALPFARKIEMTRVHETFVGDVFFPEIDPAVWEPVQKEFHEQDSEHLHAFSFITYRKK